MEPADSSDETAAELLHERGYAARSITSIFRGTNSLLRYGYRGGGGGRLVDGTADAFVDPDTILSGVGISAALLGRNLRRRAYRPVEVREASIVEGLNVEELRALVGEWASHRGGTHGGLSSMIRMSRHDFRCGNLAPRTAF